MTIRSNTSGPKVTPFQRSERATPAAPARPAVATQTAEAAATPTATPMERPVDANSRALAQPSAFAADAGGARAGATVGVRMWSPPSSPARATFLDRPKAVTNENPTWTAMTESLGQAWDIRMAGRAVDGNLLHELARYGRDPAELRSVAAELAGVGAIDSKAFEQITNNSNYKGFDRPFEERVAFALVVAKSGGAELLGNYFSNIWQDSATEAADFDPLKRLFDRAGAPGDFGAWRDAAVSEAQGLIASAKDNSLHTNEAVRDTLLATLGDAAPTGFSSAAAVIGYAAARRSGASEAQAAEIGAWVDAGTLDAETLRLLSPSKEEGSVWVVSTFGNTANLGKADLDAATRIAGDVAKGELTSGQLYGFALRYAGADDAPQPRFQLVEMAEVIKAVNRGEIDAAKLPAVLEEKALFADGLVNKVWDRMFSARDKETGNKYTVSGIAPSSLVTAPLTRLLKADLIAVLAADPAKMRDLTAAFSTHLEANLPSEREVKSRSDDRSRWEVGVYGEAVQKAFEAARFDVGL